MQLRFNGKTAIALSHTETRVYHFLPFSTFFQLNCDVNCCCDLDCTDAIIQAFKCDDGVKIDDYFHGEGLERCEIDNGWFCIVKGRLDEADYYVSSGEIFLKFK